jgi:glycogen synthase
MAADARNRVLLTADTVGGVWTYAIELARGLASRHWQVHLATMGAPLSRGQRGEAAAVPGLQLHEGPWKLEWMEAPWADLEHAARWLLALEQELRPRVVHLNQYCFGVLPFQAPTLLVAHSCVSSWWRAVHGTPAPAQWARYRDCVAQGLAGASCVGAPTAAMLQNLTRDYGWQGPGVVLPNGRDPRLFAPAAVRQPFVLSAGRLWDEAKNLSALETVAPGLPWPIRVAGSLEAPQGHQRKPQWVQALGQLPPAELAREMSRAAIYALPARYEPFGLSVLEAAMSGCALVLGDIDSLRENWQEAALFVDPSDPAALKGALRRLITDTALRETLADAARQRARHFSAERMVQAVLAAYCGLPVRRPSRSPEESSCA